MHQCSRLLANGFLYCFVYLLLNLAVWWLKKVSVYTLIFEKIADLYRRVCQYHDPFYVIIKLRRVYAVILITHTWLLNYILLVAFCLIKILNFMFQYHKRGHVFFHNWKSIRCIHEIFFALYIQHFHQ